MTPRRIDTGALEYDRRTLDRASVRAPRQAFDSLTVPLDPGISLVEASAGTGKTFCITQTVLRLLLDRDDAGEYRVRDLGRILVVTFTNKATAELVTRVRARLREAVEVFAGAVHERTEQNAALFDLLDRYGAGELPRLREALASLDRLSIFTIHGFCKRVLEESALESGTAYDSAFLEEDALLAQRAAQDWWRRTMYTDERLASLAVRQEWAYDAFLRDWKAWRRHPETTIEPDEPLSKAMTALEGAIGEFRRAWDPKRAGAFLAGQAWRSKAPLGDPAMRARIVAAGDKLAAGDVGRAVELVAHCTTDAIRDVETGIKLSPKDVYAAVPDEPLVQAVEALDGALERVRRALRVHCIDAVQLAFEDEKARRHLLGFDDLLRKLRDALVDEGEDGRLATAIRSRYDAALIDEFQDTDAYQFRIFSTAFAKRPLFLIGDPKQAIYGFRGADVFAYMHAASAADRDYTLGRNWRSTPQMVKAVNALFTRQPAAFLHDEIPFEPAEAARDPENPLASDERKALHWWFMPPEPNKQGDPVFVAMGNAEARLHATLVREVVQLLDREIRPGQMAVLVRWGYEGLAVQRALRAAGVPSIVAGMDDILASREMLELEAVMRAVLAPQDGRAVRAALATTMWGVDALGIHRLSRPEHESDWVVLVERLEQARETWMRRGFMRMVQELLGWLGALERLLALDEGERRVTNLRHAVELLHGAAVEERLSPEALLLWAARARSTKSEDAARKELRLESDADAVQIVTVHKSKGLEYDVVFCPGLWAAKRTAYGDPVLVHEGGHESVVLDHGSDQYDARYRHADDERLAEDLRLAYVALTRARLRCYVGWGAAINGRSKTGAPHSALGYLLRAEHLPGASAGVAESTANALTASLAGWRDTLQDFVAANADVMSCEVVGADVTVPRWGGSSAVPVEPVCRELTPARGQLESWRVSSFTSLTAGAPHEVADEEDARDVADEGGNGAPTASLGGPSAGSGPSFMDFPAGRAPGIALHELFERADFAMDDEALRALTVDVLVKHRLAEDEADPRVDATARMAATVLGTPLPEAGFALRDTPTARTLREFGFHLPLGLVGRHTLADLFATFGDEVARRYAPSLRALGTRDTWGFLTGVIDLAFEHDGRWYVVDWKSNHLGREPERYERAALEAEMIESHYVLQYHLYVVALHRFLRARLPEYDYETHIGGAWYAFLRGVDGEGHGWFDDRPPRALVEALDALMDAPGVEVGGAA